MAGEWPRVRIGDVAEVFDGPHATPKKTDSGPIFLGITSLKSGRLDLSTVEHISEEDFAKWTRRVTPRAGDVVFSYETKLGEAAQIPDGLRCCLGRRMGLVRANGERLDSRFFLYQYLGPAFQAFLHSRTIHGSTVDRIPLVDFPDFPIALPPIGEQRAIGHILGTLDDKIELNRRMNETLEAMARAIFKSWFVDFDPVRAKASGEPPESICRRLGLTPDLLALFPNRLVNSELGEIPEGWDVKPFSETVQIIGGGTPKTSISEYWGGEIPWFSVVDAPAESDVFVIDTEKKITQAGLDNSSARILSEGTTIISARGTVGKVALVGVPMAMNQSCYGLRGSNGGEFFTYYATRELVVTFKQHSHGAVFDTITRDTFAGVKVVNCPSIAVTFESVISPLMQKIKTNNYQARTLAGLRDTLLPKLLSGELRVPVENRA